MARTTLARQSRIATANRPVKLVVVLALLAAMIAPLANPLTAEAAIAREAHNTGIANTHQISVTAPAASAGDVLVASIVVRSLSSSHVICTRAIAKS